MMPGFIEIDKHRFYVEIWPRIKAQVDAIESNLPYVKRSLSWAPQPALLIHWGYVIKDTEERITLAITNSTPSGEETHWIAEHLITQ